MREEKPSTAEWNLEGKGGRPSRAQGLLGVVTGCAGLYVALAIGHMLLLGEAVLIPLLFLGVATLLSIVVFRWFLRSKRPCMNRMESLGAVITFLVIGNSVIYVYWSSGYESTFHLGLLGLGILAFFLPAGRLALVLVVSLAAWALLQWFEVLTVAWLHYAVGLFIASGMKLPAELRARAESEGLLRLKRSEERYALAARGSHDGLWDWDLHSDRVCFSSRWSSMLSLGEQERIENIDFWLDRIHPEDLAGFQAAVAEHLKGESAFFEHEYRMRCKDESYLWTHVRGCSVCDETGRPYRMAGSQTDITVRKQYEEQLLKAATRDPLTGLSNRSRFVETLSRAISRRSRKQGYDFGVLFIDLDRFKVINDSQGHLVGDELLMGVAERLQQSVRPCDVVARFGGDEFALFVEDLAGGRDTVRCTDRVRAAFDAPFEVAGREVFVSVSIGVVSSSDRYATPEEILRDADTAMYRAKAKGSCAVVFDTEMHEQALKSFQLETELRRALNENQFSHDFHPVVSVEERQILEIEALARWRHPESGLITAGELIQKNGDRNWLDSLGLRILEGACRDLQMWRDEGVIDTGVRLSVNLLGRQVAEANFLPSLESILGSCGLDPESVAIELSEKDILAAGPNGGRRLQELSEFGVHLVLDDFGTQNFSLALLHEIPIGTVKIDRSFIAGIDRRKLTRETVRGIVDLVQNLGIRVIAEGVERSSQAEILLQMGCALMQGYYFSLPLSREDMDRYFRARGSCSDYLEGIRLDEESRDHRDRVDSEGGRQRRSLFLS